MTELSETVLLMNSPDWKDRMRAEYLQLKIRAAKLLQVVDLARKGKLSLPPNCSPGMLYRQWLIMQDYMSILEKRAKREGVYLGE